MKIDFGNAFPAMQETETSALMDTARAMQEEERKVRRLPRAALAAAVILLMMMGAVALAETLGWQLLDSLFHLMDVSVLPGVATTENLLQVENEYVIYTVKEGAFDGFGGSVIVEIQAKDEKTLLTPQSGWSLDDPAAEVLWDAEDTGDMTIGEYARAQGYEQVVMVDVYFPVEAAAQSGGGSNTGNAQVWEYDGSRATILCTFSTRGAEITEGMLTTAYRFTAYPRTRELTPISERDEFIKRCEGTFTVPVEEPLWTRRAILDGRSMVRGTRVNSVTLTGTKLGVYMTVEYELNYYNNSGGWGSKDVISFALGDGEGNRFALGMAHVADRYAEPPNWEDPSAPMQYTYVRCYEAVETPPERTGWWLYVTDNERGKTERMLLVLE